MSVVGLLLFIIIVGLSSVSSRVRRREAEHHLFLERKKVNAAIKGLHKQGSRT